MRETLNMHFNKESMQMKIFIKWCMQKYIQNESTQSWEQCKLFYMYFDLYKIQLILGAIYKTSNSFPVKLFTLNMTLYIQCNSCFVLY